jgi:hypothetical protein
MKKVRVRLVGLIALVSVMLSGCEFYAPFVRLEQRIMVQLVGVDYRDGEYTVSMQYSMGKTSDGSKSENDLATITGRGENLYSAVKQARSFAGKEFFFSHNQVLLLGRGVIEDDDPVTVIKRYLLYCDDHSTAYVAGAHGTAEEIISLTYKDEYAEKNKIKIIIESANNTGFFPAYKIHEVIMASYSTSTACFIPMLRVVNDLSAKRASVGKENQADDENDENEEGNEESSDESAGGVTDGADSGDPNVVPCGGVLLIDNKPALFMDERQCKGLSLLVNTSNISSVDFVHDGVSSSLELFKKNTKIRTSFDGDFLQVCVKFAGAADRSYNCILEYISNESALEVAQESVKEKLRHTAETLMSLGGDLFHLEDNLKHSDYRAWLKVENEWFDVMESALFTYEAEIRIQ